MTTADETFAALGENWRGQIAHVDGRGRLRLVSRPGVVLADCPYGEARPWSLYRLRDVERLHPPAAGIADAVSFYLEPFRPGPIRTVLVDGRRYAHWDDDRYLYVADVSLDPYIVWDCVAVPRMEPVTVWYSGPPVPKEVLW